MSLLPPRLTQKHHKYGFTTISECEVGDTEDEHLKSDWKAFLRSNVSITFAVAAGTCCCILVIAYTQWLSWKVLRPPSWSVDNDPSNFITWNADNIAVVQGLMTILYAVGLGAMAYGAECISESAMWAILSRQSLSFNQMETYLLAIHGSVPATATSLRFIRTGSTAIIILLSAVTTLTPLTAAPLIGLVYAREDMIMPFKSLYTFGGGIARTFAQTNPPISVGANSQASYVSWSRNESLEPLPEYRSWMIDRAVLSDRGGITAKAVKSAVEITCHGYSVRQMNSSQLGVALFPTQVAKHNSNSRTWNSSDHVRVRLGKAVAVWIEDFTFHHANKSSAEIVFAAFNGTLEEGVNSRVWRDLNGYQMSVSSVICHVEVEFIDDTLFVDGGSPESAPDVVLSSNNDFDVPTNYNKTKPYTLNENALWFAVAPVLVGISVDGAQPMYFKGNDWNDTGLPAAYTRAPYSTEEGDYFWSIDDIKHFIQVAVGAVGQASARNDQHDEPVIITSQALTRKLHPYRAAYLSIPMVIIIVGEALLLYWNVHMHRQERLPSMRTASIGEILESSQTAYLKDLATCDHKQHTAGHISDLGQVQVRFGWTQCICSSRTLIAGLGLKVEPFVKSNDPTLELNETEHRRQ